MSKSLLVIQCKNVKRYFEEGRVKALDGVNINIKRGEFVAIIGKSGSGKSTLLNQIAALDRPTSGQVIVDGVDIGKAKHLDEVRSTKVGFIFQLHNLLPQLTAVENVTIPMFERPGRGAAKVAKARELLERLSVRHLQHKTPTVMSGGERQRVAIARALANDPAILLGDEPTGDVDTKTGEQIMSVLKDLHQKQGMTLIVVTHAPDVAKQAERIIELKDGKVIRS